MIDRDAYIDLVRKMEDLASYAGDTDNVAYFRNILNLLQSEPDRAISELLSNTFWGGSGSFFDQGFYVRQKKKGVDYDALNIEFRRLLLRLLRLLRSNSHTHPWFDSREDVLERSLK